MVIVKLKGGLGNQLFQYAFGRNLAIKNNCELKLDVGEFKKDNLRDYELFEFNIKAEIASNYELKNYNRFSNRRLNYMFCKINNSIYIVEKNKLLNNDVLKKKKDIYLDGYWQSEKYFMDIEDIIREEFKPVKCLSVVNRELINQIKTCNSVSIHIRRGDYASNPKTKLVHGLCPKEYYYKGIECISSNTKEPVFFIFSDDINWVKNNININFPAIYVENNNGKNSFLDIMLMKECKHNIIANSTFSWWGAWLNNNCHKIIVTPEKWFKSMNKKNDLIPEGWLQI